MRIFSLLFVFLGSILSVTAHAETLLFQKQKWAVYEEKVHSVTDVYVYDSGKILIKTRFSNGNRLNPTDALVATKLVDQKGRTLAHCKQWVESLQPSFLGSANSKTNKCTDNIGKRKARLVKDIVLYSSQATPQMSAYSEQAFQNFLARGGNP